MILDLKDGKLLDSGKQKEGKMFHNVHGTALMAESEHRAHSEPLVPIFRGLSLVAHGYIDGNLSVISQGDLIGVIGKVGAGKSSLLAAITAEMERYQGQVLELINHILLFFV